MVGHRALNAGGVGSTPASRTTQEYATSVRQPVFETGDCEFDSHLLNQ